MNRRALYRIPFLLMAVSVILVGWSALAGSTPFTCEETATLKCPGAPISANIPNPPKSINEQEAGITAPPASMIRPGVLVLTEPERPLFSSDFVLFKCDGQGVNCLALMESDPGGDAGDMDPNDAKDAVTYAADLDAAVRSAGNQLNVAEPDPVNGVQTLEYTAKGPGGQLTYTIVSDIPEPSALVLLASGLIWLALKKVRRPKLLGC